MKLKEGAGRLEALSDAIFGLALTFLVVRMDVPKNVAEFQSMTGGFIGFFVTFILLFIIWNKQGRFLRAVEYIDGKVKFLTACFLFLILFFVFPLKYLFTLSVELLLGTAFSSQAFSSSMDSNNIAYLLQMFALGFGSIYLLLCCMYVYSFKRREILGLKLPLPQLKLEVAHYFLVVLVSMLSFVLSLWVSASSLYFAGLVYLLLLPGRYLLKRAIL